MSTSNVRTERAGLSPAEKGRRQRSIMRALQQGTLLEDLRSRGFSEQELIDAKATLRKADIEVTLWKKERKP